MMECAIRLAVMADRTFVESVVAAAYEPWVAQIGFRPPPMDADYAELIAARRVHVAGSDGIHPADLAGLIVLIPEPGALIVDNVAVRPDLQGLGIGRALLSFAEDEARRLDLHAMRLFAHAKMIPNLRLYRAMGYADTRREPIEFGERIHLRKHLDGAATPHDRDTRR